MAEIKYFTLELFPLFEQQSHSEAMMLHGTHIAKSAIHFLNPSQVKVLTCDQLLHTVAKELQWRFSNEIENKIILLLDGLHIEMAASTALDKW